MEQSFSVCRDFLVKVVLSGSFTMGYSPIDRSGYFSQALSKRFGVPQTVENMPDIMVQLGNVSKESISNWYSLFDDIHSGKHSSSAMFSLKTDDGDFGRYWLRCDIVSDDSGKPFFAFITLDNFTDVSEVYHKQGKDVKALLDLSKHSFFQILSINLTLGTYRFIHSDKDMYYIPETGNVSDMNNVLKEYVYYEDRESFVKALSIEGLRYYFTNNNEDLLQLAYRRLREDNELHWIETTVMRQNDSDTSDTILIVSLRDVDEEKGKEIALKEQLRQQKEEIVITMSQMGKAISYYDVINKTIKIHPMVASILGLPDSIGNFPESFLQQSSSRLAPIMAEKFKNFYDAIRRGEQSGVSEYLISDNNGVDYWIRSEFFNIFDSDKKPIRAVIASENITSERIKAEEIKQLRQNEYLLRHTAYHSERIVCFYNIEKGTSQKLDIDLCAGCMLPHLCEMTVHEVLSSEKIVPDSLKELKKMFDNISRGNPTGEHKVEAIVESGEHRWFDIKYTTLYDEDLTFSSAIISHKDITEEYKHELTYQRYMESVESNIDNILVYIESDITLNRIERLAGTMFVSKDTDMSHSYSEFGKYLAKHKFLFMDTKKAIKYFSVDNLTQLYFMGERLLKSQWQVRFLDTDSLHWLSFEIMLTSDPYNKHLKAIMRIQDITEEKEKLLDIQYRSERDAMTGLFNRSTAENKIKAAIAADKPGVLILLDLDDLKGINDTFGHKEGDRAIVGIANVLQLCFRERDIVGRLGGDEFIIYLPGMANNIDNTSVNLISLLRRLSDISVGSENEQRIHCSIGCSVQISREDTYEKLFKQADTALYHIKRNGKNNFAFYIPDMEKDDYLFRTQKLFSMSSSKKFETVELQHLLSSIASFYQLVLASNLSSNNYHLMEEVPNGVFANVPSFGNLDTFISNAVRFVHPEEKNEFIKVLGRKSLLDTYKSGETNLRHYFRFKYNGEYRWTESIVIFYTNNEGDVCDFTLLRWADERSKELELLWLQKVMTLAVKSSFEYICLINIKSGEYFLYGDEVNTHNVADKGNFNEATKSICKNFISPAEQKAYYDNANLSAIIKGMRDTNGHYGYSYNMPDGKRRASFFYFEPTHTQVLMTVQKINTDA